MKKARLKKALSLLLVFSMVVSLMPALSFGAWADESEVSDVNKISSAWLAAIQSGTLDLTTNWNIKTHETLIIPDGKSLTINMNGHMISRHLASPESDGEVFKVGSGSSLTLNGGDDAASKGQTHKGHLGDSGAWFPDPAYDSKNLTGAVVSGGYSSNTGGGIQAYSNSTVTLNNVTLAGNLAYESWGDGLGGGVRLNGSGITLTLNGTSQILYNYAEEKGGGIYVDGADCTVNLNGTSKIDHNCARDADGGGVYFNGARDTLNLKEAGTSVSYNSACGQAGGILLNGTSCQINSVGGVINHNSMTDSGSDGGGILISQPSCKINLSAGSQIDGNTAHDKGGGIYVYDTLCSISMDDTSEISSNTAGGHGGGIYVNNDSCTISGGTISNNNAGSSYYGGGIYLASENDSVYNCTISGNKAQQGGGIYVDNDASVLSNCTITGNTASDSYGGGVYVTQTANIGITGTMIIQNNTAAGQKNDLHLGAGLQHTFLTSVPNNHSQVGIYCINDARSDGTPVDRLLIESKGSYSTKPYFSDIDNHYIKFDTSKRLLYYAIGASPDTTIPSPTSVSHEVEDTNTTYNSKEVYKGTFSYPSVLNSTADMDASFYYSDGYFAKDPTTYDAHLATMSLDLAMSAFGANAGNTMSSAQGDYTNKFCHVTQLLSDIGCDDDNIYVNSFFTQKPEKQSIGVAIAQKDIKIDNKSYTLVPIAIRGAGYESEWYSNVSLGSGSGEAEGFSDAADKVMTEVDSYIKSYGLADKLAAGTVKFWVVGYSRAGATANITSKRLVDKYGTGTTPNQIYGYTFEAPQGGVGGGTYPSIHNIINQTDIVPKVGPSAMGFSRYGVEQSIPYRTAVVGNTEYNTQKTLMLKQLNAVNPNVSFDDYFHIATINYLGSSALALWADNLVDEVSDPNNIKQADYINYFVDNLITWALNEDQDIPSGTAREKYSKNAVWITNKSFEAALQDLVYLVFSKSPQDSANIKNVFSTLMDKIGTFELIDIYDNAVGDWKTLSNEKKMKYIDKLWNKLSVPDGKTPCLKDYLNDGELTQIYGDWKVLADVLLTFVGTDYQTTPSYTNDTQIMLGTFLYNSDNIMMSHYPEVNLAWLRSYDDFYKSDTKQVSIDRNVTAVKPTADKNTEPTYAGSQTIKLSTTTKGDAIYYTITSTADTKATDPQLYQRGITLKSGDTQITYTITAYSMWYGKKSGPATFTYTIKPTPKLTLNAYDKTGKLIQTTTQYSEGSTVTINAYTPADKVFEKWTVSGNGSGSVTLVGATDEITTFTMPSSDVTIEASYTDRISAVTMTIEAPTGGSELAGNAKLTFGTDSAEHTYPVTWSAGSTAIGTKADYNTVYTATLTIPAAAANKFASDISVTASGTTSASAKRNNADGSVTVTCVFPATAKAKLTAVIAPTAITVAYGTTTDQIKGLLPQFVTINTEIGYRTATVVWNENDIPVSDGKEKKATLSGTLTCPSDIDPNSNGTASISVTIQSQPVSAAPTASISSGTYTSAQSIALSAAAGAKIYYTTNGSEPTIGSTSTYTYTTHISLSTDGSTTIKAIAIENGKAESSVATYSYTIAIPKVYTVTVNCVDPNGYSETHSYKYTGGTTVVLPAPTVSDEKFSSWFDMPSGVTLSSSTTASQTISFTMPSGNVALTANYTPVVGAISFRLDVPAGGVKLDTQVNKCYIRITNGYYLDPAAFTVTWSPSGTDAAFNTIYTANIALTKGTNDIGLVDENGNKVMKDATTPASVSASAFTFAAHPTVTVNGDTASLIEKSGSDSISYTFPATDSARLLSVTQPDNLYLSHGLSTAEFEAKIPQTVGIRVEDGSVTSADVRWVPVKYDPDTLTGQAIVFQGFVTLPNTITNPDKVSTYVTMTAYVDGAAQVSAPNASPEGSSFTNSLTVALKTNTSGASIHYTTDGTTPTAASTPYTGMITLSKTMTLQAIAVKTGMQDSSVSSFQYELKANDTPVTPVTPVNPGSSTTGGGGGGGAVTVPATSNAGSAQVSAAVTNGTATIAPTDEQIKTVASTTKDTGTVKVDVSSLKADTAVFPAKLVTASEKAMSIKGITLVLPAASVSLDKTALDNVSKSVTESGKDVTVTAKPVAVSSLSETQKTALGSQAGKATVVSVSMLVGDTKVTAFGGGSATISVPYTLKTGETAGSITVWYLADDGTISPMHGKYDAATKTVSFTTTHLSDYAVVSFPFTDVSEDAWYYGDVAYAYVNGLFSGTSNTAFSPALTMNRAMLVTVLWRLAGKPVVNYAMNFSDVAADTYYTEAVRWAASNKIVTGYSSSSFGPSDTVTREQMAAILYRYAQFKKYDVSIGEDTNILSYTDAFSVSEYAMPAMQWACGAELIKGSDGKLLPKDGAQRCQVAAILTRFCKNVVK